MKGIRQCLAVGIGLLALGAAHASTVIGLTVEDQARLSRYVVVGEVVALRGVDHVENGLETEVTLKVAATLKGDVRPGQSVAFHTRSGELDGVRSVAVGETVLRPGQKVLVFIEDVDGRLYNIGLSYGVFSVTEDAKGRVSFTRALEDGLEIVGEEEVGNGPFSIEDMRTRIGYAAKHPRFDSAMVRETFGEGR
ncbi:MAG TPA: hypothetical protein VFB67_11965 [Candidatus Polarisedimenticolaceae bacterium]|nr:hypothetical protein [Candidatus Polarisedimenticolaceae bacterium]